MLFRLDDHSAPSVLSAVVSLANHHDLDHLAGCIVIVCGHR
jgi:hypothetical protein